MNDPIFDGWDRPFCGNPLLPGYNADPSLIAHEGRFYVYATIDPWGGETLACWESADLKDWSYRFLNWPTKAACRSDDSGGAMVWAPSVVRGSDGRFYMYVSVGSEVWAGVAEHPLGPWRDLLGGGRPLIPRGWNRDYHMIDAEAFVDDDGVAYLYWGSGLNWVNGRCFAARLRPDMAGFDGDPVDVTPGNYFEAPFVLKRGGRYYLMYSNGITVEDTYRVHYAVGAAPLGPFVEAPNSPILFTGQTPDVVSPGHHAVFEHGGRHYILYHRHGVPFDRERIQRQVCVDELRFTVDGLIAPVVPTHAGPEITRGRRETRSAPVARARASSVAGELSGPERVLDGNYATRWAPAADDPAPWLELELEEAAVPGTQYLRFEYAWKRHRFALEASADGERWTTLADHRRDGATGSPVEIPAGTEPARRLRLVFAEGVTGAEAAVFTWTVGSVDA